MHRANASTSAAPARPQSRGIPAWILWTGALGLTAAAIAAAIALDRGEVAAALAIGSNAVFAGIAWRLVGAMRAGGRDCEQRLATAAHHAKEREELLHRALRLETVGGMAGLVAHQLRNHLHVIGGDAALGQTDAIEAKDRRFAKIQHEIDETNGLLEQMLDLSHPANGALRRVDLTEVCSSFARRVRGILPASIRLTHAFSRVAVLVDVDPIGLQHALLNLVLNAREAMPAGGTLSLDVCGKDGCGAVTVRDTGVGIPDAQQRLVFEPYFTTKPRGRGTGLGLAAVARFVKANGGRVAVASREGEGAEFSLFFPIAAPSAAGVSLAANGRCSAEDQLDGASELAR